MPEVAVTNQEEIGLQVLTERTRASDKEGEKLLAFDLIAVHGLYGHRTRSWSAAAENENSSRTWLEDSLHVDYPCSRILTFGYKGREAKCGVNALPDIRREALRLLDDLLASRVGLDKNADVPLVLVAHDFGGIIVKKALEIGCLERTKYANIVNSLRILIFFACPHRCKTPEALEDQFADLVLHCSIAPPPAAVRKIERLARSTIEINRSCPISDLPSRPDIINVYSRESATAVQVFDSFTATLDVAFERRVGRLVSHNDLSKINKLDRVYIQISEALERRVASPRSDMAPFMWNLNLGCAPTYPTAVYHGSTSQLEWLTGHKSYTRWLESDGPSILHVHSGDITSEIAGYIAQNLRANQKAEWAPEWRTSRDHTLDTDGVFFFSFDENDDRCNSATSMIQTFLGHIFAHNEDLYSSVKRVDERLRLYKSWTLSELMDIFRSILIYPPTMNTYYVIDRLDKCDTSRSSFLREVCFFGRSFESRFRIVITSDADLEIRNNLANWPSIDLDKRPADLLSNDLADAFDLESEARTMTLRHPALESVESKVLGRLQSFRGDRNWLRITLSQLSHYSPTELECHQDLKPLWASSPRTTFAQILARIPDMNRPWAYNVLMWMLYSFRPLHLAQLAVALAMESVSKSHTVPSADDLACRLLASELDSMFCGMIIISHNEVRFGHPDLRAFLLETDGKVGHNFRTTAHQKITDACFSYLSLAEVQDSLSHSKVTGDSLVFETWIPRDSFAFYAVKYWPQHSARISETATLTVQATQFIGNKTALRCWTEAYWSLSNLYSRRDRSYLSLLPLVAGVGAGRIVLNQVKKSFGQQEGSQDCAEVLIESARNGHLETVRKMLRSEKIDVIGLREALIAATSSPWPAVLEESILYVERKIEGFEWPEVVLRRAAQLGLDQIVARILSSSSPGSGSSVSELWTPIQIAAEYGHSKIVRILLQQDKEYYKHSNQQSHFPLCRAAANGHEDVVNQLLHLDAEPKAAVDCKQKALREASLNGAYRVIHTLCKRGADPEDFKSFSDHLEESFLDTTIDRAYLLSSQILINNGAVVNSRTSVPLLHKAVERGDPKLVKLLVDSGAEINATDWRKTTALHVAVLRRQKPLVVQLLDSGADVNQKDRRGANALLLAANSRDPELVQLLISRTADVACRSTDRFTPLDGCFDSGEITQALLDYGADPNLIGYALTPLANAANQGGIQAMEALLRHRNIDIHRCSGRLSFKIDLTPLAIASFQGQHEAVRILLEAGADVNLSGDSEYTVLGLAVLSDNEETMRTLMEYRPDLTVTDDLDNIPLHDVGAQTPLSVVKLLVNAGSNLEARNKGKFTPFACAIKSNNEAVVKYLLTKKVNINVLCGEYGTPLHMACRLLRLELIKILHKAGADLNNVVDSYGTPLDEALSRWIPDSDKVRQDDVVRYLIEVAKVDVKQVGGTHEWALNIASGWSTPHLMKLLVNNGASIDEGKSMGRSAIHYAASASNANFSCILEAGGDIKAKDMMGRAPLHFAAANGQLEVVKHILVLDEGIVDQRDANGWTPLLWASRGCRDMYGKLMPEEQAKMISLLLDHGADPSAQGQGLDRVWTTVQLAKYHGQDDAAQTLTEKVEEWLSAHGTHWEDTLYMSRKARIGLTFCDSCFHNIAGIGFRCRDCLAFDLCQICFQSKDITHPNHRFVKTSQISPTQDPRWLSAGEDSEGLESDNEDNESINNGTDYSESDEDEDNSDDNGDSDSDSNE